MQDVCLACYWGCVDDNVFETFVKTFRKYNQSALLQVHTDNEPKLSKHYKVQWRIDAYPHGRRALKKLETVCNLVHRLPKGSRILVSDIDVYFLSNPFSAFSDFGFDIGFVTRPYWAPVNGGILYLKTSEKLISFLLTSALSENTILQPEDFPKTAGQWPDWFIDQDYLCWLWNERKRIRDTYGLKIADVGQRYNFCPGTDVYGNRAKDMLQKIYRDRSAVTLHLKGPLKKCIYEGWLEDAVTCHLTKGGADWQNVQ